METTEKGRGGSPPRFPEESRACWSERAKRRREASAAYWKVDWGVHADDAAYRRRMAQVVQIVPGT